MFFLLRLWAATITSFMAQTSSAYRLTAPARA